MQYARNTLYVAVVLACATVSGTINAQDAQASPNTAATATETAAKNLDAVKVTARKREESVLEVPVVLNVLTKDQLERAKIDNLYAVSRQVPGLVLGTAVNSSATQVSLRGVGTTALNPIMDQSVSLNVDGLPLTQGAAYGAAMFDVGQIEVLKGPQALFFGKNSPAGVVSLLSNDPTEETEIIARFGYEAEAKEKVADLILSGAVSDTLKLRLATRISDQDGFFYNDSTVTPNMGARAPEFRNYAPTENLIVRGTAIFEPNESYSAKLKVTYNKNEMNGGASPLQITSCPEGTASVAPANVDFLGGIACKPSRSYYLAWADPDFFPGGLPNNGVAFENNTQTLGSLEQNLAVGSDLTLTAVTGFYKQELENLAAGSTTNRTMPFMNHVHFSNEQFTQEVRLTSDYTDSPVNFMVGAFYQNADLMNNYRAVTNSRLGLPPVMQHFEHLVDVKSTSVFGQVMWELSTKWELAAGARWTKEVRDHVHSNLNAINGPIGPIARPDPKLDTSNLSPELSVTYKASDNFTIFGSYKTGFKSGSFNTSALLTPTTRASFNDEEVRGGEVGIKLRTEDRSVNANVAVYNYKYQDMQVGAMEMSTVPGGSGYVFSLRTINAASATVRGLEADINYLPQGIDGLTITGAFNYNDATYDSFTNAPCGNGQTISMGCDQGLNAVTGRYSAQDLSGKRLVRAPKVSLSAGFNQELYLDNGLSLGFGAGAKYMSKYATALVDTFGFEQPGYVKYDANITLRGKDDRWELSLIGVNLGNELTRGWCVNTNGQNGTVLGGQLSGAVNGGPAGQDESACSIERGREIWARMSWRFR